MEGAGVSIHGQLGRLRSSYNPSIKDIMYILTRSPKGSSIIIIIFTSVHSVLFFVTPSQKRTFKMLIRNNPYQKGRVYVINRRLQTGVRNKTSHCRCMSRTLQSLIVV